MALTYCTFLEKQPSLIINHLPRIISTLGQKYLKSLPPSNNRPPPPHPSRHLLLLLSPPCQVEVESDPAELIGDDLSSDSEDIDIAD